MTASSRGTLMLPVFAWVWVAALAFAASQGAAPVHKQAPIALVASATVVAACALAAVFGVARQREVPVGSPSEPLSYHAPQQEDAP